jgi:heme O synthase-like polyprenyltransferase
MNSYDLGFGLGALFMGQLAFLTHRYASVYLAAAGIVLFFLAFYLSYYFIWLKRRRPSPGPGQSRA